MRLSDHLAATGLTREQFAAKVGAHPITVSKWATGAAMPRPSWLTRIMQATDEQVTAADFHAEVTARASRTSAA